MAEHNQQPFTASSFNRFLGERQLMGARCRSCGALHLPPRPICNNCHVEEMEWVELSGQGKLMAFTTIHIAPTAMIEAGYGRDKPYCTGIVQLQEGPAISAQILGVDASQPETIAIGMALRAAFVERGEGEERRTFLVFKP